MSTFFFLTPLLREALQLKLIAPFEKSQILQKLEFIFRVWPCIRNVMESWFQREIEIKKKSTIHDALRMYTLLCFVVFSYSVYYIRGQYH